jgi:threonine synthase
MGNLNKLVVATNSNDILARFWRSGSYELVDSTPTPNGGGLGDEKPAAADGGVQATLSLAMDIPVSSNFERLLGISRMNHLIQLPIAPGGPLLEPRSTVG